MMALHAEYENSGRDRCCRRSGVVGPLIMIAVGGVFLLDNFMPQFSFGDWWPLILVVVGGAMLIDRLSGAGSD